MMMTDKITRIPGNNIDQMTRTMKHCKLIAIFLGIGIYAYTRDTSLLTDTIVSGSYPAQSEVITGFDFFGSEEPLEMTLAFDFNNFLKTRNNPEYINAILTIKLNAGNSVSQRIKIKARGEVRRTISDLPPIMMKFKNDSQDLRPIREKGTLKLVAPCKYSTMYKNYVLKEYLAYRMFSLVTPYSFRTRLVKISYKDNGKPKNSLTAFGFLIENEKDMAARNDAVLVNRGGISHTQVNSRDLARVAVYNYMIGNTDWYLSCQHNIQVIKPIQVASDKGIPVAFDFDYSGFVNAEYAIPSKTIPIEDVKERYYLGTCFSDEEIKPVIDEFVELKEAFISTIENFDLLSQSDRKMAEGYINSFYKSNRYNYVLISDLNRTCIHPQ
jgi:hypothetical protein